MRIRQAITALTAGATLLSAAQASASEPLSAIDWLSDSMELTPETAVPTPEDAPAPVPPVSVSAIGATPVDSVGLRPSTSLGIAPALWGRSAAADIAARLAEITRGEDAPPSLVRLLGDLMLVRLDPPIDAATDDSLFLARLDTLLALGRLADAERLTSLAPDGGPDYFRRLFDVSLLLGTEREACGAIERSPDLSPTYVARVFCLARNGEWEVAALTLGTAKALGMVTPQDEALILYFLDPEFESEIALPAAPRLPTPLQFRMYEAIGERIATDTLPLAYAWADQTDIIGWQARLRAAERLTAAGAMSPRDLIAVYEKRAPAASGSVWSRVGAVQAFIEAARSKDDSRMESLLSAAWEEVASAGMHAHLAPWFARQIGEAPLSGAARHVAFEIALYADDTPLARRMAGADKVERFLLALHEGTPDAAPPPDRLAQALVRGLTAKGVPERYANLTEDARQGEALLAAMSDLMDGAAGNTERTADALVLMRHLGLHRAARRIAVEIMLTEGAA